MLVMIAFWPGGGNSVAISPNSAHAQGSKSQDSVLLTPFQQKLNDALGWTDSFDFDDVPLKDFATEMGRKLGTDVVFDSRALEDLGLPMDAPITLKAKGISNRSALRLVLDQLELDFVIGDEYVQITSIDESEQRLGAPRAYPIWDLVKSDNQELGPDYDSLIELITSICAPSSWDVVGGPGSLGRVSLQLYRGLSLGRPADAAS